MKLKECRIKQGYTQSALGKLVDVSQRTVAAYESGQRRPSPEVAQRIAALFNLSAEEMWEMLYSNESNAS